MQVDHYFETCEKLIFKDSEIIQDFSLAVYLPLNILKINFC
jgi:hypothetical protein